MRSAVAALALAPVAVGVAGCKPDKALKKAEVIDRGALPSYDGKPAVDAGEITGTVAFKGTPPPRVPIDMSMDPACAMAAEPNLSEGVVVTGGKLANVYVTVTAGAAPTMAPVGQAPVVLDQKGCRYTPHVIAVQQGGRVEFRNSDPTVHNIHAMPVTAGDETIDVSEQPGAAQTHTFTKPEQMMPVRCNNHPWMNAYLNVAPTPYFAVTGTDGRFRITNLPPGTYRIAAIQEKLGEQDTTVTVAANGKATADFTFGAK